MQIAIMRSAPRRFLVKQLQTPGGTTHSGILCDSGVSPLASDAASVSIFASNCEEKPGHPKLEELLNKNGSSATRALSQRQKRMLAISHKIKADRIASGNRHADSVRFSNVGGVDHVGDLNIPSYMSRNFWRTSGVDAAIESAVSPSRIGTGDIAKLTQTATVPLSVSRAAPSPTHHSLKTTLNEKRRHGRCDKLPIIHAIYAMYALLTLPSLPRARLGGA